MAKDPGELNNLTGNAEYKKIEHEPKAALREKMILDYDYLPLPIADKGQAPRMGGKNKSKKGRPIESQD